MEPSLSFYCQQGRMSSPGSRAALYTDLPAGVAELVRLVQGLTIHIFWAERYGLDLPPERKNEVQLRSMQRRLGRTLELDARPLREARPNENKLVGNCRDFSLFLASVLRHQGIPARARCGFGTYFLPGQYVDHWVTEVWQAGQNRWVLVDAQLDTFQSGVLKLNFDPLDVPRDQFVVAGTAWQMCRSGKADPEKFGIFDMHGLGFVRGNLVRDLAALNRMELLPWDCWGVILKESIDDPDDLALLDHVAALTSADVPELDALIACYENDPRLFMDGSLVSYVDGQMTREVVS